jgi:large subunit ribosomal protein L28
VSDVFNVSIIGFRADFSPENFPANMRLFTAAWPLVAAANPSSSVSCAAAASLAGQRHCLRAFSTTLPQQSKTIKAQLLPSDLIPPYPYGERRVYKQSNRGLYGQARIRFGNIIAPKGLSKSRRFWRPNIHVKVSYVKELDANIKTRLTLRVLKSIRREGGLVNYLLKSKPARIKEMGPSGWRLRWLVMQTRAVQERFNEERIALGLEPREIVDRSDLVHYAMDYATPGPLSVRSRETVGQLKETMQKMVFDLGEDIPADAEVGEELSDEAEEALLNGMPEEAHIIPESDELDAKVEKELRV